MKSHLGAETRLLVCLWFLLVSCGYPNSPPGGLTQSNQSIRVGVAAAWVHSEDVPVSVVNDAGSEGLLYEVIDDQVALPGDGSQHYFRARLRMLNAHGVQATTGLSAVFDPVHQSVTWHFVRRERAGLVHDLLKHDEILVLQRETDLERQQLSGLLTSHIVLNDVRVGDVIDYAYTIESSNSLFAGHYADVYSLEWDSYVAWRRVRLQYPATRKIQWHIHGTNVEPQITTHQGQVDWQLIQEHIAAERNEGETPAWYSPYAWLEFSDFSSWAEVAAWAKSWYDVPELSQDLQVLVTKWKGVHAAPELRALTAIRYVQDEIRYLGIESGIWAYKPNAPSVVQNRRFGDCKDKTLLLRSLLSGLGIQSYPLLVNTQLRQAIADQLPSPLAFNHVVLDIEFNSSSHCVDATSWLQGGALTQLVVSSFGLGLPLRDSTTNLNKIPQSSALLSSRLVVQENLCCDQYESPASLRVETEYQGFYADTFRRQLAGQSPDKTQQSLTTFYSTRYPSVRVVAPYTAEDDRENNHIRLVEFYEIPDFWTRDVAAGVWKAEVSARLIADQLSVPSVTARQMPLGLAYPSRLAQTTCLTMPEDWAGEDASDFWMGPGYRFSYGLITTGRFIRHTFDLATQRDHILPSELEEHLANQDKIRDLLSWTFSYPIHMTQPGWFLAELNWPILFVFGLMLLSSSIMAVRIWKHSASPVHQPPPLRGEVQGLGGWLILLMLNLLALPILTSINLVHESWLFRTSSWGVLTSPSGANYHPLWSPVLIMDVAISAAVLPLSILALTLFFKGRKLFRRCFICVVPTLRVWNLVSSLAIAHIQRSQVIDVESQVGRSVMGLIAAVCWSVYLYRSQRATNTFRN